MSQRSNFYKSIKKILGLMSAIFHFKILKIAENSEQILNIAENSEQILNITENSEQILNIIFLLKSIYFTSVIRS
jgi:hypothetical protein